MSEATTAFEAWNDYDPSMRFITAFPISEAQGTTSSTVAYYEIEPGRHSGLHSDNAEEVIYVADGEGEIFISGRQERLEAGEFVFVEAGVQHDIYAYGDVALRLLSFFPTKKVESTFTELLLPFNGHVITSETTGAPELQEISFEDLPPELAESMGFHGTPVVVTGDEEAPDGEQPEPDTDALAYWGLTGDEPGEVIDPNAPDGEESEAGDDAAEVKAESGEAKAEGDETAAEDGEAAEAGKQNAAEQETA